LCSCYLVSISRRTQSVAAKLYMLAIMTQWICNNGCHHMLLKKGTAALFLHRVVKQGHRSTHTGQWEAFGLGGVASGLPCVSGAWGSKACRRPHLTHADTPSGIRRKQCRSTCGVHAAGWHAPHDKTCPLAFSCVMMPILAPLSGARGGRPPRYATEGRPLCAGGQRPYLMKILQYSEKKLSIREHFYAKNSRANLQISTLMWCANSG
jgi:hypothetical protein